MNAVIPFLFDGQAVRVTDRDGQPWFVLADACAILGLKNPTAAARPLDETEKAYLNLGSGSDATIVSLSGLLTLMLRCRGAMKPDTVPYRVRKWITAEVVPSIIRTGSYAVAGGAIDLNDPATLHRLLLDHTKNAAAAEARVAELAPKAAAWSRLAGAEASLCVTDAAKALGVPPRRLFAWLEAHKWLYRRGEGGHWVGYQTKIDGGSVEHIPKRIPRRGQPDKLVESVAITAKGLARLAELRAGA